MTMPLTCYILAVMTTHRRTRHQIQHPPAGADPQRIRRRRSNTSRSPFISTAADLPQLAKHFYAQAVEERNHAMMLVQYLIDRDVDVEIPGIDPVRNTFDSPTDALRLALEQERTVTEQISRLAGVARDEGDYLGEQFMQWFLKEQVEEVALMTTLVRVAERAGANLFHLEDFVAREIGRGGSRPDRAQGRGRQPLTVRLVGPLRSARSAASPWCGRGGWWPPTRRRRLGSTARPRSGRPSSSTGRGRARRPGRPVRGARAASRSTGPPRWRRPSSRRCRPGTATSRRAAPSAASAPPGGSATPRPPRTTSPPRGTGRPTPARRCRTGAAAPAPCSPPARRSAPDAWSR